MKRCPNTDLMLATVYDAGPALNEHCANLSCLLCAVAVSAAAATDADAGDEDMQVVVRRGLV